MQAIHLSPLPPSTSCRRRKPIPLFHKLLQVVGHVLFELPNTLGTKGMRHSLPLARMFSSIARIEKAALDGDKSIVIVAARTIPQSANVLFTKYQTKTVKSEDSPLQPPPSMTVDNSNRLRICN